MFRSWTWAARQALRNTVMGGLAFASLSVWADVYGEINEKINSGQYSVAQSLIERETLKRANDPQIRLLQSQMQLAQGQTQQALETLLALTQEFPELPEPYNNLAVLYAAQHELDQALNALLLAIKARPDYSVALENLGDVYIALAQQSFLKAQTLSQQTPLIAQRLASKIEQTGLWLKAAKP